MLRQSGVQTMFLDVIDSSDPFFASAGIYQLSGEECFLLTKM